MSRMDGKRGIVSAVLLLNFFVSQLRGDYQLNIRVHSYSNPSHTRNDGHCCDWWWHCGECDNYFIFCLRPAQFLHKDLSCPLARLESGEVGGDSITFRGHVGMLSNPFTISVPGPWTGTFQLRIDVYDDDTLNDDFVDKVFAQPVPFTNTTTPLLYTGLDRISQIKLSFSVKCSENYYGPECLTFCEPRNDTLGHFTCNQDGSIQCLPNYFATNCTEFCIPIEGRYGCNPEDGSRFCLENYFREDCKVFCVARNDDLGHYSCNKETGGRECLLGYREPASNCTELLICDPPCHLNGGGCNATTLQCQCFSGWSGEQCQLCALNQGCPTDTYRKGSGGITEPTSTQVGGQLPLSGSSTNTAAILGPLITVIVILCAALMSIFSVIICKKFRSQPKIEHDDLTERMLNGQATIHDGMHNASYDPMAVGTFNANTPPSPTQSAEVDFHNPLYHSTALSASVNGVTREDLSENSINSGSYSTIDHRPLRKSWALRPPAPSGTYSFIEREQLDSL